MQRCFRSLLPRLNRSFRTIFQDSRFFPKSHHLPSTNFWTIEKPVPFKMSSSPPPTKKSKKGGPEQKSSSSNGTPDKASGKSKSGATVSKKRVQMLAGNEGFLRRECKKVCYYMHRDQRVQDNWALLYAQSLAMEHNLPLTVVAMITAKGPGATLRTLDFCLRGLDAVAKELASLDIPFNLLVEQEDFPEAPAKKLAEFFGQHEVGCVVTDFSALRQHQSIVDHLLKHLDKQICVYRYIYFARFVSYRIRVQGRVVLTGSTPTTSSPSGSRPTSRSTPPAPSGTRSWGNCPSS